MREYLLIRSKRKTVALAIKEDGALEVRAPMRLSKKWIDGFVEQKEGWIQQKTAETAKRAAARRQPSAGHVSAPKKKICACGLRNTCPSGPGSLRNRPA